MGKRARELWVSFRWHQFLSAPENQEVLRPFLGRHPKVASEPEFFDALGEDFMSSKEAIRAQAFWVFITSAPELTDIVHEGELRQPGFRGGSGAETRWVNQSMKFIEKLHRVLVTEAQFHPETGKDPRPFIRKVTENWERDIARRKENQNVSLDLLIGSARGSFRESLLKDSSPSPEEEVLRKLAAEGATEELRSFRSTGALPDSEWDLFYTFYGDEQPLYEIRASIGLPTNNAVSQRLSRARRSWVAARDWLLEWYLCDGDVKLRPSHRETILSSLSEHPLQLDVSLGLEETRAFPLTRSFDGAPSMLVIIAEPKGTLRIDQIASPVAFSWDSSWERGSEFSNSRPMDDMLRQWYRRLDRYPDWRNFINNLRPSHDLRAHSTVGMNWKQTQNLLPLLDLAFI